VTTRFAGFLLFLSAALIFCAGPARASSKALGFYSKLALPVYSFEDPARQPAAISRLYIGSNKSYAAEPKEIAIAGRTLSAGVSAAALLQPLSPLAAAGFFIVGAYNVSELISLLTSRSSPRSEWSFIWSQK